MLELLKNSFRAMIDRHGAMDVDLAPPVSITVASDGKEVGISIMDVGGGMSSRTLQRGDQFFGSSAPPMQMDYTYSRNFGAQFDGLGFGVPMVRLHAQLMGGGLAVGSVPGHGTHTFVTLQCDGANLW